MWKALEGTGFLQTVPEGKATIIKATCKEGTDSQKQARQASETTTQTENTSTAISTQRLVHLTSQLSFELKNKVGFEFH